MTVADDGKKSYQIQSYDPVIRGSLMLMKFLDDRYDESTLQEWIDRGELLGIRFTLTHEDPSVPEKEIVTDQYGYAATKHRNWYMAPGRCGKIHLPRRKAMQG